MMVCVSCCQLNASTFMFFILKLFIFITAQPCKNGGTCGATEQGFQCFCVRGFTGLTCSNPLPACNSVPCFNGATCYESSAGYVCVCLPGREKETISMTVNIFKCYLHHKVVIM